MEKEVYKPGKGDIFVGVLVSIVASLIFLPLTGMIAVLVKNLAGTGQSTATGILILQSALVSIVMFRTLWNDAVHVREVDKSTTDSNSDMEDDTDDTMMEEDEE